MDKHFRYIVFLSLFFMWDDDLYREYFASYYDEDRFTPMSEMQGVIGIDKTEEGYIYADKLMADPPKVRG